jgi:hypothetical protein
MINLLTPNISLKIKFKNMVAKHSHYNSQIRLAAIASGSLMAAAYSSRCLAVEARSI